MDNHNRFPQGNVSNIADAPAVVRALAQASIQGPDAAIASSLLSAWRRFGSLSEKQLSFAAVIVDRNTPKQSVDASGLFAMFTKARQKLKRPVIRLRSEDGEVWSVKQAPESSTNAGALYVFFGDSSQADGGRIYAGKITPDGQVRAGRDFASKGKLLNDAVLSFAADPAKAAKAYGSLTGSCCFCGRTLDDAGSVKRGYGPVCARNFGLEHQSEGRALKAEMSVTGDVISAGGGDNEEDPFNDRVDDL